jgi:predicted negative regulator of RcsB-dependent stress response
MTEQEQIEILKRWLKQYGLVILAGIILALLVISGWRYWQERRINMLTHASILFDEMINSRAQNQADTAIAQAKKLRHDYSDTPYAQMAAFMLAKEAVANKQYPAAIKQLNWLLDHSDTPALKQMARTRLARIMLAQNKPAEALKTLEKVEDKTFIGLINEIKGDAYAALKDTSKAQQAYQQALAVLPDADSVRPLLQMKYDNLTT